jgi:ABC-type nickel/cobalt efflux system permease component RcnA
VTRVINSSRCRITAILLALALLVGPMMFGAGPEAAADPFTGGRSTTPAAISTGSVGSGLWAELAKLQRGLNSSISSEFKVVRDTGSHSAIAIILGIAFLYGVLHAAGPGHGKSVVAAYFVANQARWTSGVVMGGLISLIQGLFAIVMVFLFSLLLNWKQFEIQDRGALVEFVSYGLIVLLGGAMLYRAIANKGCGHDHGPPASAGTHRHSHDDHAHDDHAHDDHGRDHHGHGHGDQENDDHRHDDHRSPQIRAAVAACGHVHGPVATDPKLILAAGLTPCPSAFLILFFALANGVLGIGVIAVLALSVGMGMTVSGIGVLSIVGRGFLTRVFGGSGRGGERLERVLSIAGSVLIVAFAGVLMLNAWTGL